MAIISFWEVYHAPEYKYVYTYIYRWWAIGRELGGRSKERVTKKEKTCQKFHTHFLTRIFFILFYVCIYILHPQSPYHDMYKFYRGKYLLENPPSPPILGSNYRHDARPPLSEQKTTAPFKPFLPSFGFRWFMGGRLQK